MANDRETEKARLSVGDVNDEDESDDEAILDLVRRIRASSPPNEDARGRKEMEPDGTERSDDDDDDEAISDLVRRIRAGTSQDKDVSGQGRRHGEAVDERWQPSTCTSDETDAANRESKNSWAHEPVREKAALGNDGVAGREPSPKWERRQVSGRDGRGSARLPNRLVKALLLQTDVLQRIDRRQRRLLSLVGRGHVGQPPLHALSEAPRRRWVLPGRHSGSPPLHSYSMDSSSLQYYHRSGNYRTLRPCHKGPTTLWTAAAAAETVDRPNGSGQRRPLIVLNYTDDEFWRLRLIIAVSRLSDAIFILSKIVLFYFSKFKIFCLVRFF